MKVRLFKTFNEELKSLEEISDAEDLDAWLSQAEVLEGKIQLAQDESVACSEAIEGLRLAAVECSETLSQVRSELQVFEGERSSLEALEKAGSGHDAQEINSWLKNRGLSKKAD